MRTNYLVFTDLDGTLLDHHDYSWDAAKPALERCEIEGIPVIFNTSKTAAEALVLQRELSLNGPIIVENGSAIVMPTESLKVPVESLSASGLEVDCSESQLRLIFGLPRSHILAVIEQARTNKGWSFEGFNDWSVDKIAKLTGLALESAARAADKAYSEPFLWNDSDAALEAFQAFAEQSGLRLMRGGRFYHLQGQTDKAKPMQWLKSNASILFGDSDSNSLTKLICLGDNHNDVAMLNIADFPVCVRSPVGDFPQLSTSSPVIHTRKFGPSGWNEAIQSILA